MLGRIVQDDGKYASRRQRRKPLIVRYCLKRKENTMPISTVKATFRCSVKRVWETVTDLKEYFWRSDLERIEIIDETHFVEHSRDGTKTSFKVTVNEYCCRWEFDIENTNIKGHWKGIFTESGGKTTIKFTDNVIAKKFFMNFFIKGFLKKQQALYIADLKKALGE